MMTVIFNFLILGCALISLTSCGTKTLKREALYTIKTNFSSTQFKDCSLSLTTQANYNAEVKSESSDLSTCGLKAKIKKIDGNKFLMSLRVELSDKDTSRRFNTKVIGTLGEPMILTPQKSKSDDTKYTFLIEKTDSL